MRLLLLSLGTGAIPAFLDECRSGASGPLRIGYLSDAAAPYEGLPFVAEERARVEALGHEVLERRAREAEADAFDEFLGTVDAVYVAGGNTFVLLEALRSGGAERALLDRVRAGLPYIGTSAGAAVTGPSIAPLALMDDPAEAPALHGFEGLGLMERTVLPHADGRLPPYPPETIRRTIERYGRTHPLVPLRDDQALLVDDDGPRIVPSA